MPSLARLSRTNTPDPYQADPKRRKSSVASLKALPLPFRNKSKDPIQVPATHTERLDGTNLLDLPTELQLQILRHLSFSDLCALRATSREFNQSVTGPDSAITRYWIASKLHNVHRLYPAPSHHQWRYLCSQMHRWNTARHLADMIARHIQYKTLLYVQRHSSSEFLSSSILAALLLPSVYSDQTSHQSTQRTLLYQPVAQRIRRRMTPLLFAISHYLSSCQSAVLSSPTVLTLEGESAVCWTCIGSPDLYPYPVSQLLSMHYCWLFLEWIFNSLLSRPSYAGSIERAVRGWRATPLDAGSLIQVLVHGNLGAVKQLFMLKDYGERKKWAKTFLRNMNPEINGLAWWEEWDKMHLRVADVPSKAQAAAVLRGPSAGESLWTKGAARRLRALGVDLGGNELHKSVEATMRFLTDMAGFDLFHEQPPEDFEADEDVEDDDDNNNDGDVTRGADTESNGASTAVSEGLEEEGVNYWDV